MSIVMDMIIAVSILLVLIVLVSDFVNKAYNREADTLKKEIESVIEMKCRLVEREGDVEEIKKLTEEIKELKNKVRMVEKKALYADKLVNIFMIGALLLGIGICIVKIVKDNEMVEVKGKIVATNDDVVVGFGDALDYKECICVKGDSGTYYVISTHNVGFMTALFKYEPYVEVRSEGTEWRTVELHRMDSECDYAIDVGERYYLGNVCICDMLKDGEEIELSVRRKNLQLYDYNWVEERVNEDMQREEDKEVVKRKKVVEVYE